MCEREILVRGSAVRLDAIFVIKKKLHRTEEGKTTEPKSNRFFLFDFSFNQNLKLDKIVWESGWVELGIKKKIRRKKK